MARINNLVINRIAKFTQRVGNHPESVSFVVRQQIFHVLQQECARSVVPQHPDDIKEKGSLRFIRKTVRTTKRDLFRYTSDGERLTRKTRKQGHRGLECRPR